MCLPECKLYFPAVLCVVNELNLAGNGRRNCCDWYLGLIKEGPLALMIIQSNDINHLLSNEMEACSANQFF